jgi:hypothetical protein
MTQPYTHLVIEQDRRAAIKVGEPVLAVSFSGHHQLMLIESMSEVFTRPLTLRYAYVSLKEITHRHYADQTRGERDVDWHVWPHAVPLIPSADL